MPRTTEIKLKSADGTEMTARVDHGQLMALAGQMLRAPAPGTKRKRDDELETEQPKKKAATVPGPPGPPGPPGQGRSAGARQRRKRRERAAAAAAAATAATTNTTTTTTDANADQVKAEAEDTTTTTTTTDANADQVKAEAEDDQEWLGGAMQSLFGEGDGCEG